MLKQIINQTYPFELPPLDYEYSALEPHIDAETMNIHHNKHHAGYVTKLNTALENYPDLHSKNLVEIMQTINQVPEDIRQAVINSGGGHINHTLFWQSLTPNYQSIAHGKLNEEIINTFGNMDDFRDLFTIDAASLFGSGWTWLVLNSDKELQIVNTPNQNSPYLNNQTPIFGLDLWEHAYYLNYQNRRADYIEAFWKIVNWENISKHFDEIF